MTTTILYFSWLKEELGRAHDSLELTQQTGITQLVRQLVELSDDHARVFQDTVGLRCAVNKKLADWDAVVQPGDEVAIFPPVTGG